MKVLIVDDDPIALAVIQALSTHHGAEEVLTADTAEGAWRILQDAATPPDLVILELMTGRIDCLELVRLIAGAAPAAGIILTSARDPKLMNMTGLLVRAHGLALWGILPKPINREVLADRLRLARDRGLAEERKRHVGEPVTEEELALAIEREEIRAWVQPKVSAVDRSLLGVEILARWETAGGKIRSPADFIPVAQQTGLMTPMTDSLMRQAIAAHSRWRYRRHTVPFALNVCATLLGDLGLPERWLGMLRAAAVSPELVTLELTESVTLGDLRTAMEIIGRFRLAGTRLSIDDFGTGYSSLEQVERLAFTEFKLDRGFVDGASKDPGKRAIVESSVHLAKRMGLTIVAEGVETREDWRLLRELGVDKIQGFLVARPMPPDELLTWLPHWTAMKILPPTA